MPGETVALGETAGMNMNHKEYLEGKYPGYKILLVSKSECVENSNVPMTSNYEARHFVILSKDPKDSRHPDNIVMGCPWELYTPQKKVSQDEGNEWGGTMDERFSIEHTTKKESRQSVHDSLPDAREEASEE